MFAILDTAIGNGEVIGLGLGVVFFGLVCLILITWLLGKIIGAIESGKKTTQEETPAVSAASDTASVIPNRAQFVAAVSAAIAEDLGTDVSKIQIISIKKVQ